MESGKCYLVVRTSGPEEGRRPWNEQLEAPFQFSVQLPTEWVIHPPCLHQVSEHCVYIGKVFAYLFVCF